MTQFRITGQVELQRRLTAIGKAPKDMLRDVGLHAVREAKILVPRKTGNLGRTIRIGSLTDNHVEVKAGGSRNVGYAAAVEFGSKAHVIVPKTKSALFFPSQKATTERFGAGSTLGFTKAGRLNARSLRKFGGGAFVHARRVKHPGTQAKPFLIPGFVKALKMVGLDKIVAAWNKAA